MAAYNIEDVFKILEILPQAAYPLQDLFRVLLYPERLKSVDDRRDVRIKRRRGDYIYPVLRRIGKERCLFPELLVPDYRFIIYALRGDIHKREFKRLFVRHDIFFRYIIHLLFDGLDEFPEFYDRVDLVAGPEGVLHLVITMREHIRKHLLQKHLTGHTAHLRRFQETADLIYRFAEFLKPLSPRLYLPEAPVHVAYRARRRLYRLGDAGGYILRKTAQPREEI